MNKVLFFFLYASPLLAQLPETDIHLFELKNTKGKYSIVKSSTLTSRPGYDNQPSFSADEKKVFYVSIKEDKQADAFELDLASGKNRQITKTAESEYSPTYDINSKKINCVVVEKDSAQRIHAYDPLLGNESALLLNEDSVGYFTFLNKDTVLYYKLTSPHSLRIHSLPNGKDEFIASSVVRGFKMINRHQFIYGIKDSSKVSFYKYDLLLGRAFYYCQYPSLSEDIFWHSQWGLLKSENTKILRFDDAAKQWTELFDLASYGIKKITRFLFDSKNKRLLVVDNK